MRQALVILTMVILTTTRLFAQGYVDQQAVYPLLETQIGDIDNVPKVDWEVYIYKDHNKKDGKGQWSELLAYIKDLPGEYTGDRRYVIELTNRVTGDNMKMGQKLLIPKSFPNDWRAYSPYPFQYAAATDMPKLFIIDKSTQTFGAYEYGKLVRWGLVSTGRNDDLTPVGRYNFNWKDDYRLSSEAPEGELWEMYWMFNFDARLGMHVHQYSLPIAYPASHGCVRVSEADAKWNFGWANGWSQSGGRVSRNGTPVMVIGHNPAGRPQQWNISGEGAVSSVDLPSNMESIPLGSYAQREADWASGQ
ncbi:L,D-transpeptidase [Polluticoccus soli]|uniref:L,D-transpeptidase n=1 Tax=Polluticoccus soli TaxID=3034150 RepID=UPI0023E09DF9|nr:L,D-transpeptidase [Flavipsychrobacter sp. JY13-12]